MFRNLTRTQLGVDLGIAAVFAITAALLAALGSMLEQAGAGAGWLIGLTTVAAIAPTLLIATGLALRRLSPSLALLAAWVGALVQMAIGQAPGFVDLPIFAVLFATAAYGDRLVYWAGLASAGVGAVVITTYIVGVPWILSPTLDARSVLLVGAVLLAALVSLLLSWTTGALARSTLRARSARQAALLATAQSAVSDERERIARDMHDVVAHSLAVVIAQADGARYAAAQDADVSSAALATISTTARAALADVRMLLAQLRHRQGDGPQPGLADLDELYAQVRAAGMSLAVEVDPAPPGVPPTGVQLAVYRILQEALTNALRHGADAPVVARLSWHADHVELSVRNRVPVGGVARASGHGLIGMGERAQLAGGTLTAAERDGEFAVEATIPIGVPAPVPGAAAIAVGAA